MTDYLIYHIQYVTVAPHPDRNSLDNLFRLLDHLDVLERDKMLEWMYLAFLAPPGRLHHKSCSHKDFFQIGFVQGGSETFVLDADFAC
jgi:hypothetical protein